MKKEQRTKKKKIMQKVGGSTKRNQRDNSPIQNGRKMESQKEMQLVGSQKRKARKQSITRNAVTLDTSIVDEQGPNKGETFMLFKLINIFLIYNFSPSLTDFTETPRADKFCNYLQNLYFR